MLSIDASLIVIFLIVWVLVFVLSRLFFHPLQKVTQEREDKVQGNREACEKSTEVYEKTVYEIEEWLKSAKALCEQTKERFEREALKERERMLAEINTEYRRQVEKARKQLEKQTKSLKRELDAEAIHLAERIEQKVLE